MTELFRGANKWDTFNLLLIIFGMFIFIILRLLIPISVAEIVFWVIFAMGCGFTMITLQIYIKQRHQSVADEVDIFCDGIIRRGVMTNDEFLLGFTYIKEIELDWDNHIIEGFQASKIFKEVIQELLREEAIKDFHARRKLKQKITTEEEKKQFQKQITYNAMKDTENYYDFIKENPESVGQIELPYVRMNLESLKIDAEKLKSYKYYYALMYDEENFPDQTVPFERAFLILPGEKEELLKGYRRIGFDHGDYPIHIRSVVCFWLCLDWVLDNIPVLLLRFSENMSDNQNEEIMKADEIKYLQMQALVHLLNVKRGEDKQKDLKLERLEIQTQKVEQEYYLMVQDLRKKEVRSMGTRTDRITISNLERQLMTKTKIQYFALAVIVILFVLLMIVLMTFTSSSRGSNPSPPSEEANLLKNMFSFINLIKIK